ncbi:MAG TPA: four helix bundle protein [Gemmatimonadales bacterium]|nr:four helix bundle protein [Gemmatimonadales bacterium]
MPKHYSLAAWQEARSVVIGLFGLGRESSEVRNSVFYGQAIRAGLSVQLNLAEGWAFGPSPTLTRHLRIAYGSAVEVSDLIALMIDLRMIAAAEGEALREHSDRCLALLVGLLKQHRPVARTGSRLSVSGKR